MLKGAFKKSFIFGLCLMVLGIFLNLYTIPAENAALSLVFQASRLFVLGFFAEFVIDMIYVFVFKSIKNNYGCDSDKEDKDI